MKERHKELRLRLMGWGVHFRKVFRVGQPKEMPKERRNYRENVPGNRVHRCMISAVERCLANSRN